MAIKRARKQELLQQYQSYLAQSQGVILLSFQGLSVPEMQDLRKRLREQGAAFMVVKNTLLRIALQASGYPLPETSVLEGPTAAVFALQDSVLAAKAVAGFLKEHEEQLAIKGGYYNTQLLTAQEVLELSKLPTLTEARAQLLGLFMAPATQLVRLLQEPARRMVAVLQAYVEKQGEVPQAA